MSEPTNQSRRRFVKLGAIGVASVPLLGRVALAQEQLSEDDPTAQSLHYRHDASQVDHPSFEEGRHCGNCQLYQGGDEEWGGCAIFPGKLVANAGWCTAWVPKA